MTYDEFIAKHAPGFKKREIRNSGEFAIRLAHDTIEILRTGKLQTHDE